MSKTRRERERAGPDTGVSTLTFLEGPVILGASRGARGPPEKKEKKEKRKKEEKRGKKRGKRKGKKKRKEKGKKGREGKGKGKKRIRTFVLLIC